MVEKNFKLANSIYIPEEIFLKFCDIDRQDTIDGKLSFPSYFKKNGKVTHETSMSHWGNNKIPTKTVKNKVSDGYIINLSVSRSGDWYSSGRSMMRIYSPEGFEFEITVENFCYICEYADISRKYINCELAFGFCSGKPILIPKNSPLYEQALIDTDITNGVTSKTEALKLFSEKFVPGKVYQKVNGYSKELYLGKFQECNFKNNFMISGYLNLQEQYKLGFEYISLDLNQFGKTKFNNLLKEIQKNGKDEALFIRMFYNRNYNEAISHSANQLKNLYEVNLKNIDDKVNYFGKHNFDKDKSFNIDKFIKHVQANDTHFKEFDKDIKFTPVKDLLNKNEILLDPFFKSLRTNKHLDCHIFVAFDQNKDLIIITCDILHEEAGLYPISIKLHKAVTNNKKLDFVVAKEFNLYAKNHTRNCYRGSHFTEVNWSKTEILGENEVQHLLNPFNIMKNLERINSNYEDMEQPSLSFQIPYLEDTMNGKKALIVPNLSQIQERIYKNYIIR